MKNSKPSVQFLVWLSMASLIFPAGCTVSDPENGRDATLVRELFEEGRFGYHADVGLFKQSLADHTAWDLVAVFFGSTGDLSNCRDAAGAIMHKAGGEYSCRNLNE